MRAAWSIAFMLWSILLGSILGMYSGDIQAGWAVFGGAIGGIVATIILTLDR